LFDDVHQSQCLKLIPDFPHNEPWTGSFGRTVRRALAAKAHQGASLTIECG